MILVVRFCSPCTVGVRSLIVRYLLGCGLALGLFTVRSAIGGNEEGIPIGVEASVLGGAVTARVSEASAAWYNPAGIAHSNRSTVNLNVRVYGIDFRTNSAVMETPSGERAGAKFINWKLVPSAFGVVRQVTPNFNFAAVMLVPSTTDFTF